MNALSALLFSMPSLQRGRAPESAEWSGVVPFDVSNKTLQRGRAPESAECRFCSVGSVSFCGRFNGAALRRARSAASRKLKVSSSSELQRGRAPESAEWESYIDLTSGEEGFNGAALRRARSGLRARLHPPIPAKLQRGRAPESAEWHRRRARLRPREAASTGPRSGERGVGDRPRRELRGDGASTGPRSGERGVGGGTGAVEEV